MDGGVVGRIRGIGERANGGDASERRRVLAQGGKRLRAGARRTFLKLDHCGGFDVDVSKRWERGGWTVGVGKRARWCWGVDGWDGWRLRFSVTGGDDAVASSGDANFSRHVGKLETALGPHSGR